MLLVVFSLVTAGLMGWNVHLNSRLTMVRSEMTDVHELADILMTYMETPDAYDTEPVRSTDRSVRARGLILRQRNGNKFVLVAEGLPRQGERFVYQIWLYDREGRGIPIQDFRCDEKGRAVVIFQSPIASDHVVEIGIMLKSDNALSPNGLQPILDGKFRSDQGMPLMLAAASL